MSSIITFPSAINSAVYSCLIITSAFASVVYIDCYSNFIVSSAVFCDYAAPIYISNKYQYVIINAVLNNTNFI